MKNVLIFEIRGGTDAQKNPLSCADPYNGRNLPTAMHLRSTNELISRGDAWDGGACDHGPRKCVGKAHEEKNVFKNRQIPQIVGQSRKL